MLPFSDALLTYVGGGALIFSRVLGLFTMSPIFGRRNLVTFAKIILSLFITYILMPITTVTFDASTSTLWGYAFLIAKETILGLIIGYVTTVIFLVPLMAGQVIDMQIGFGMVQIFDPMANAQTAMTGTLLNFIMLITFMYMDGHLVLIEILAESFSWIPPGTLVYEPEVVWRIVEIFLYMLLMAVRVAMPIIGIMAIAEVALGIIVRSVPQMNVFVLGIPLKIFLGVLSIFMILPIYIAFTEGLFNDLFKALEAVFQDIQAVRP